ncbi:M35 family metallo-endopeptidase [Roseobacter sp. CCS2]|uniref:M35 family metallo-endopeptidase n=1 Tax=Roseobacter sp. CCS2 TaxID=391593 RepID=UPI0000F3C4C9|nr:M35 family metallo-endopeptidase [Roseobacter sp. CCS2]EBA11893.1 probable protease precursor [Roseobacter sp. CCS2]
MWRFVILLVGLTCASLPAAADSRFAGCDVEQSRIIDDAFGTAKDLTLKAAVAVGDTADYQRWFGDYSAANAEQVRASLKSIVVALRSGAVTAQCDLVTDEGCDGGNYAWVYAHEPYLMHLCPSFFNLPPLTALRPGDRRSDNGTREGTIVHEISHFRPVAQTEDHCYSRSECSQMAQRDARRAIENADSYQYFTEDVTYFARQPMADKPPPAPRANR